MVDKLAAAIANVVATPAFRHKAQEQGAAADYLTPARMDAAVKTQTHQWAAVEKTGRIEAD